VLVAQATLMLRATPHEVAEAFIGSRMDTDSGRVYGTLTQAAWSARILERAWPQ
jgi:putative acyl-CoA dehydrogenase